VTEITAPSRWTHIWEQGFDTIADLDAYRRGDSPEAAAARNEWSGWMDGVVTHSAQLYYEVIPGDPPATLPGGAAEPF
jgi:hypothetical protein